MTKASKSKINNSLSKDKNISKNDKSLAILLLKSINYIIACGRIMAKDKYFKDSR